jgi:signal transduction histidine kinase
LVQLRTQRTALALYGVLLVLPTLVLGGLQWRQLTRDHQAELDDVPQKAEDTARRFREELQRRLDRLIDGEEKRAFTDYADVVCADDTTFSEMTLISSPLVRQERPHGILAWFAFDTVEGKGAPIDLWTGNVNPALGRELEGELAPVLKGLSNGYMEETALRRAARWGDAELTDLTLEKLAVNRLYKRDMDCLQLQQELLASTKISVHTTRFHLQFLEENGKPFVIATRRVLMAQMPEVARFNDCLERFKFGMALVQGFFIDPNWMFRELPELIARTVTDPSQRFVPTGEPDCCEGRLEYHADIYLLRDLGIETDSEEAKSFSKLRIAADTAQIDSRYEGQLWRFLCLAAMLTVGLATGMGLLLRSVKKDLEQASRTENFVAAVTHELRTPLSAIRLHGEMLLEGWASGPEKQQEYYRRILRETDRLSTLVERVLEKSRLSAGTTRPVPGDLNRIVEGLEAQISQYAPSQGRDIAFELAPDLPRVLLTPEAVTSILVNLVENARKYAPVELSKPETEPIRVVTRVEKGAVVLEVLDRGPGVAPEEAPRIFEAFYRVGNETTRTSRGTGLGLHLVALQAKAIGGEAGVRPRVGGGSVFWVRFEVVAAAVERLEEPRERPAASADGVS